MGKEEKNPNRIYIIPELVEEILFQLPWKSILRFKSVSKTWRSIVESRIFTERRMKIQKKLKILAAGDEDRTESRFSGDEEMEMVYLHSDDATLPSLTCEGLVCIPIPGYVNVLNPTTGESLSFPSGPDPGTYIIYKGFWCINFPGNWVMGFGKDIVNGNYKIVRMFFEPNYFCEVLDLNIGEWRRLSNGPTHKMDPRRKSAYVNGSIYWLEPIRVNVVLVLDLHTEEFRDIPLPNVGVVSDQLVNLEDRVALVRSNWWNDSKLEILILDQEERWSVTYSVNIMCYAYRPPNNKVVFTPLAISKKGNLYLCDSKKRLFKYYPERKLVRCISQDICVISLFFENFVSFPKKTCQVQDHTPRSQKSESIGRNKWKIPNILLTTTLVYLVVFRYFVVSARSSC